MATASISASENRAANSSEMMLGLYRAPAINAVMLGMVVGGITLIWALGWAQMGRPRQ